MHTLRRPTAGGTIATTTTVTTSLLVFHTRGRDGRIRMPATHAVVVTVVIVFAPQARYVTEGRRTA